MNTLKLFTLSVVLVACSSSMPKRDFEVTLYESDYNCLEWVRNNETYISCRNDDNHPENVIAIKIKDYMKEREYQAKLKNACKSWK